MIDILENEELKVLNHSCAHLLAAAVKNLYPNALFWVGPAISEGFYYDIDLGDDVIKEEDLVKIEKEMNKLRKDGKYIVRLELSKEEALEMFKDDKYKLDLIERLSDEETITAYKQGEFVDLCRGPHVASTKEIKYFKLLKVAGAYFKGDSNEKMLTRIYGICFNTEEELTNYLNFLEEAKKCDHKILGRDLELFMTSEYAPGFPFFMPKGMILREQLEGFWKEMHTLHGYEVIKTPIMLNKELWEISGHWFNYKENMYISSIDDKEFAIKPMNCPGGILYYKHNLHSYKEFPLRVGELGLVHRHESSGSLNGLFRVRAFTQDDAHIFLLENQIEEEITNIVAMIDQMYGVFGLEFKMELSTRPDKYVGELEVWDRAEKYLENALIKLGRGYKLNPGDGAFYGPKIDFHIKDSLGRVWQCGTIQLDMNLPERFDLVYTEKDGSKQRPVMLHRVVYGSIERFIGILIEHYKGAFPLWLSPVGVNIIPVNNEYHLDYCKNLQQELLKSGIRVNLDDREEKLGYKMREAQMKKVPYNVIIGDKEVNDNTVSYRQYAKDESITVSKEEFITKLIDEIKEKK